MKGEIICSNIGNKSIFFFFVTSVLVLESDKCTLKKKVKDGLQIRLKSEENMYTVVHLLIISGKEVARWQPDSSLCTSLVLFMYFHRMEKRLANDTFE